MNSILTQNIIRFISLIIIQVILCCKINFMGYIDPYIYIIFIFLYPINNNRLIFIFVSFLLGVSIDIFLDSGGVHAASAVFLSYVRPVLLKTSFGTLYEHQTIKFNNTSISGLMNYLLLGTIIHHLMLFSLEIFNVRDVVLILKMTLFSGVFTFTLSFLIILLFNRSKK